MMPESGKNKCAVLHPTGTQSGRSGAFWAHLAILFSSGILIHASGGKPYGNGDFQPFFWVNQVVVSNYCLCSSLPDNHQLLFEALISGFQSPNPREGLVMVLCLHFGREKKWGKAHRFHPTTSPPEPGGWFQRGQFEVFTVDGSEIRRSPVEVGSLSRFLQGFKNIPGGCWGFLIHQQYPCIFQTARTDQNTMSLHIFYHCFIQGWRLQEAWVSSTTPFLGLLFKNE